MLDFRALKEGKTGQKGAVLGKKTGKSGKRGSLLDLLLALLLGQAAAGFLVELGGQLLLVGPALLLRRQLVLEDTGKGVADPISPFFAPKNPSPQALPASAPSAAPPGSCGPRGLQLRPSPLPPPPRPHSGGKEGVFTPNWQKTPVLPKWRQKNAGFAQTPSKNIDFSQIASGKCQFCPNRA